jgi:hypothetical protein
LEGFCAQVIMRRVIVCVGLILCALAITPAVARAQLVPVNPNSPAATLLLPYFEVDLDNLQGQDTLFTVNNASATAILAHVTIWTDLGVPAFAWNIYLTGYDAQPIDLRAVLLGTVPSTASAGQDPQDKFSPKGILSQDINFASCSGQLPTPTVPVIYAPYLRAALTGAPSSFHQGMCVGRNLGTPSIARGYVTVDTVNNCTLRLHGDIGYFFPGGSGDVTNQNTLWGDYLYINPSLDEASGDALVHITASGSDPQTSVAGQYTFYGRFTSPAFSAADNRQPLSTNFAARFVAPKDFKTAAKARRRTVLPASTELLVWRDPKIKTTPFVCGSAPPWYPLGQEQVRAINEQEQQEVISLSSPPFPAVTQRVVVGSSALPVTSYSGWLYLNLNTAGGAVQPAEDPLASQAWVSILQRVQQGPNGGRYDVGFRAIRLDSAESASHFTIF